MPHRLRFSIGYRIAGIALASACALPLAGCYVLKQGCSVIKYTHEAIPIKKLQNRPDTPDSLREFLRLVGEIRRFAADSIGLVRNGSFSTYVNIDKTYLVDVVYGAGKLDFTPYQWRFPFFGTFPYKGFFDRKDAQKEADRLIAKGYDAFIGRVDAFSTLGFFSDPLYSFMSRFSVYRIASLILHEQTHATIYYKNQAQFNEELAMFVGNEGALRFIRANYGDSSERYINALHEQKDDGEYFSLIKSLYRKLKSAYDGNGTEAEKLEVKRLIIRKFKDSISANYDSLFSSQAYRGMAAMDINNALIAADMTYTYDLNWFYELYRKKNRDFRVMLAILKKLKNKKGDIRKSLSL
jgi:predicted aminopeptidase